MTIIGHDRATYPDVGALVRFVIPGEERPIPVEVSTVALDVDTDADSALGIATITGRILREGRYGVSDEEEPPLFYGAGDTILFYVTSGDEWFPETSH